VDLNAPLDRPPDWQARYNLCVAGAREEQFKLFRLEALEGDRGLLHHLR
jgi:hypothetical protein